jgi:hypothetical protein
MDSLFKYRDFKPFLTVPALIYNNLKIFYYKTIFYAKYTIRLGAEADLIFLSGVGAARNRRGPATLIYRLCKYCEKYYLSNTEPELSTELKLQNKLNFFLFVFCSYCTGAALLLSLGTFLIYLLYKLQKY